MTALLRSLLLLFLGGALWIANLLHAEVPTLPPRPSTNNPQLVRLQAGFSNSGITHPQNTPASTSIQTAQHDERFLERLPPPGPVRQTSFATHPLPAATALTEESYYERIPMGADYGDEHEYEDEVAYNATLDKPLFSKKPSRETGIDFEEEEESNTGGWTNKLIKPNLTPLFSIGGSLLIVIAAFFLLAILLRKVSPQSSRALPKEAFECLGRYFLTQKHQLQVLRLGNRIVLVSVMPDGVSTLAEITDPDETVAFLGLCRRLDTNSVTDVFRKTVASMSAEELNRSHDRPVITSRHTGQRNQLDLYSDPDESLASILARGRQR